jgi:Rrf2 family cysteine metabolism transcriptional repressor
MMFSTKAEYGVRVMVALAQRAAVSPASTHPSKANAASAHTFDAVMPLAEIAEHDGLPLAYLEHLVARLRKAGLVDSRRGSRGGYMLARPASEITMAEVVEALEGSIAPIECITQNADGSIVCSRESSDDPSRASHACPTKLLWTRVRFSIVRTLTETSLADLLVDVPSVDVASVGVPSSGSPKSLSRKVSPPEGPSDDAPSVSASVPETLVPAPISREPLTTGA